MFQKDNQNSGIAEFSKKSSKSRVELQPERILRSIVKAWPWVLICLVSAFFLAKLSLKYIQPKYAANLKLLIKDTRSSGGMSEATIFQDLGILNTGRNLDNEIQILQTVFLMEEVVKRLELQYNYQVRGRVTTSELYRNAPVNVVLWEPMDSSTSFKPFELVLKSIKGNDFLMELADGKEIRGQFGMKTKIPQGELILGFNAGKNADFDQISSNREYILTIYSVNAAASKFKSRITVSSDPKTRATVLDLACNDDHPQRAKDILSTLVNVYNETEINDNNRVYKSTLRFIDERMAILGNELRTVEGAVANFKLKTGFYAYGTEATLLMTQANEISKELSAIEAEILIAQGIANQLKSEATKFDFVPTSQVTATPNLAVLLTNFNELLLQREKLKTSLGAKNPDLIILEKQLENLRVNIIENTKVVERELSIRKNSISTQNENLRRTLSSIPQQERELIEIEREKSIKREIFLYLLQKREEADLSLNVTVANNRIIEPARSLGQVSPKETQILLSSLVFGFILPIGIVFLRLVMNQKIMNEDDIVQRTDVPLLGSIPLSKQDVKISIGENKRSAIAEMFRLLRANLQFVGEGVNNKVMVITSTFSGEGKSFICLNLGLTLAIGGKRTVIVELDMRKPKLIKYLGSDGKDGPGITNYLSDDKILANEIISRSGIHDNIDYIACGPIPPNPSELLLSERLEALILHLRSNYDYVLIDTPPVGLVSDSLLLNKLIDLTLYIVRHKVTFFNHLDIVSDIKNSNKMPRPYIVFNGVDQTKTGYGYGYGYSYGYGYGYYEDEKASKVDWFKGLFKKKK